jgi:predicted GH43/DUF377 family glycosyl hydrolase
MMLFPRNIGPKFILSNPSSGEFMKMLIAFLLSFSTVFAEQDYEDYLDYSDYLDYGDYQEAHDSQEYGDYRYPDKYRDSRDYQGVSETQDYRSDPGAGSEIIEEAPRQPENLDLEEMAAPFVLETKRLQIPGYPDAYNPSIVRWNGRLLMSFRTYHPETKSTHEIALVYLNEDLEPASAPKFIRFASPDPQCLRKRQDPRLVVAGGRLYIAYNNSIWKEVRRMLTGEIEFIGDEPFVRSITALFDFEGENQLRSQKNWVPFDFNGDLHFAYSIVPHRIMLPIPGRNAAETVALTHSSFRWDWGVPRGGTPPVKLENGEYLAFFHSSKNMATEHSEGQIMLHYFMGAYTFSSTPPFGITRVSPGPIVGKNFYKGKAYKTWKPLRVVFPGGIVADERFIWVFYGRQDHEIWIAKLDKKGLLDSLVPVCP